MKVKEKEEEVKDYEEEKKIRRKRRGRRIRAPSYPYSHTSRVFLFSLYQ